MEIKTIELIGKKCIQCHICETICPTKSISFHKNEKGFIVPLIGNSCINCGKCLLSCPEFSDADKTVPFVKPIRTLFGFSSNYQELLESSSGGIFYLLAKKATSLGYDIISTVYSDDFRFCFYSCSNNSSIKKMRKSKYCESDFSHVVQRVANNMLNNKKTLVCGTPCHINSLRYKFCDNPNLFLVDFICHGVPSTMVFNDMISFYERKMGGRITQLNFRNKMSKYSSSLVLSISTTRKTISIPWDNDRFYFAFEKYWILRDSCYFCRFKDKHSGDLTLGDFWDGKSFGINVDNKNGCSLIFLNTKKGEKMIESISNEIDFSELKERNYYSIPHKLNSDYNKQVLFFEKYKSLGFVKACDYLFFKKQKIKTKLKKIFRIAH